MANLLSSEFGGSTLSTLASLGVAAYDEEELTSAVLEQARVRAATGIRTTASISAIEQLEKKAGEALAALPAAATAAGSAVRDELRMRQQLLRRLLKTRRVGAVSAAQASLPALSGAVSGCSSAAAPSRASDVLASLGRRQDAEPGVMLRAGGGSSAIEPGQQQRETATFSSSSGPRQPSASSLLSSSDPEPEDVLPFSTASAGDGQSSSRNHSSGAAASRGRPLQVSNLLGDGGDVEPTAKPRPIRCGSNSALPMRKPSVSNAAPSAPKSRPKKEAYSVSSARISAADEPPPSPAEASGVASGPPRDQPPSVGGVQCPVCLQHLGTQATDDAQLAAVNRHIDRCLRRRTPAAAPSSSGAGTAANHRARSSAKGGDNEAEDDDALLFDSEPDDDDDDGDIIELVDEEEGAAGEGSGSPPASSSSLAEKEQSKGQRRSSGSHAAASSSARRTSGDGSGRRNSSRRPLDDVTAARVQADDDIDLDELGAAADGGEEGGSSGEEGEAAPRSSSRGGLSRAERSTLGVEDDWYDHVYAARVAAAEEAEEAEGGAAGAGDTELEHGLRVPRRIATSLFPYQLTGVRWMWELHRQRTGGILGDEMGLGKTVQIAALLGALAHTGLQTRPALVVCPATVISHWVKELQTWWPRLRVIVLHDSGTGIRIAGVSRSALVRTASACADVLVTTYEGVRSGRATVGAVTWGYAILDEGHRIRNPDAAITAAAKDLRTSHRLILTGAPIQNRLRELWSLFDFVYPGRLGSQGMFEAQFAGPIAAGGWTHASALQVATAYQCAVVLRDLIGPYLLRRLKRDVNAHLPTKTEQVLFCRLTEGQRDAYMRLLRSDEVADVLDRRAQPFRAVTMLRKICNHVALSGGSVAAAQGGGAGRRSHGASSSKRRRPVFTEGDEEVGDGGLLRLGDSREEEGAAGLSSLPRSEQRRRLVEGSGKMGVVAEVLRLWRTEGHRALLFCQGRAMLSLLERYVSLCGYAYLRMDGTTPIRDRGLLVDKFNSDSSVFLFLLTTRVGGVGINLIGANRVLIFDPDWNPSTDTQARERAWRLGQTRHVTVYRLITAGTIEEKIYHRQVFKTVLTQKVLSDPGAKRLFNFRDLRELFTLSDHPAAHSSSAGGGGAAGEGQRLPTETEQMAPHGMVDFSQDDGAGAPAAAAASSLPSKHKRHKSRHKQRGQADNPAADTAALESSGLVAGHEEYLDPDASGDPKAGGQGNGTGDDEEAGGGGSAAPRARQPSSSQTSMLQALYGQGELAGVFSHDTLDPGHGSARAGAVSSMAASIQHHASRVAREALRSLAPTIRAAPSASDVDAVARAARAPRPPSAVDERLVLGGDEALSERAAKRERKAAKRERKERKRERHSRRAAAASSSTALEPAPPRHGSRLNPLIASAAAGGGCRIRVFGSAEEHAMTSSPAAAAAALAVSFRLDSLRALPSGARGTSFLLPAAARLAFAAERDRGAAEDAAGGVADGVLLFTGGAGPPAVAAAKPSQRSPAAGGGASSSPRMQQRGLQRPGGLGLSAGMLGRSSSSSGRAGGSGMRITLLRYPAPLAARAETEGDDGDGTGGRLSGSSAAAADSSAAAWGTLPSAPLGSGAIGRSDTAEGGCGALRSSTILQRMKDRQLAAAGAMLHGVLIGRSGAPRRGGGGAGVAAEGHHDNDDSVHAMAEVVADDEGRTFGSALLQGASR